MEELPKLTLRQLQFMALTAEGKRYREIAEQCFVAEQTVQNMLFDAKARMECTTVTQAIIKAIAFEILILDSDGAVSVPASLRYQGRRNVLESVAA